MLFSFPPDLGSTTNDRNILEGRLTAIESRVRALQKILPGLSGDRRHESELELRDLLRDRRDLEDRLKPPAPLSTEQEQRAREAAARRQRIIDWQVKEDEQILGAFIEKCERESDWKTARQYRQELLLSRERAERLYR